MKTLYININDEQIQSNEELEVLNYDLNSDFFFYLGEKIAIGCKVENENALITDFNTQDNKEDYQQIISQWSDIKAILFSEECKSEFEFTLPKEYIHWLKFHPQYVAIYDANFSHGESRVISIDLEELFEESIEELHRKILRKLKRDDLYLDIDEIVFNDDAITRKSSIVRAIKEKYEGIGYKVYKKWMQDIKDSHNHEEVIDQQSYHRPYHRPSKYAWETDAFMAIVEQDKKKLEAIKQDKERRNQDIERQAMIERYREKWRRKEEKKHK